MTPTLPGIDMGAKPPPEAERQVALGQWFTPPWLAAEVAGMLGTERSRGRTVVEPSAGDGAIVRALLDGGAWRVIAVEIDPAMCVKLRERFSKEAADGRVQVIEGDFLTVEIPPFDYIAGNPPYDDGMDTDHLARIADLLEARPKAQASLLLRTVALHSGGRYERVWRRVDVNEMACLPDRVPFLAAGGEAGDAGKIDVSIFRLQSNNAAAPRRVRWVREPGR